MYLDEAIRALRPKAEKQATQDTVAGAGRAERGAIERGTAPGNEALCNSGTSPEPAPLRCVNGRPDWHMCPHCLGVGAASPTQVERLVCDFCVDTREGVSEGSRCKRIVDCREDGLCPGHYRRVEP